MKKQSPATTQLTICRHIRARSLKGRYNTITKLGWGFGSTVWLAEDMWQRISGGPCQSLGSLAPTASICKEEPDRPQYVAVKIGTSAYGSIAAAEHELKLSQHIARTNPSHPGAGYIRTPIDNFRIDRPHGASSYLFSLSPYERNAVSP